MGPRWAMSTGAGTRSALLCARRTANSADITYSCFGNPTHPAQRSRDGAPACSRMTSLCCTAIPGCRRSAAVLKSLRGRPKRANHAVAPGAILRRDLVNVLARFAAPARKPMLHLPAQLALVTRMESPVGRYYRLPNRTAARAWPGPELPTRHPRPSPRNLANKEKLVRVSTALREAGCLRRLAPAQPLALGTRWLAVAQHNRLHPPTTR